MSEMTPREIVQELDKHIIGQADAKRAVAIALRNRWRRMQVSAELRDEITPKNILMIGPTGVGKTEIARRLAHLANAPFIKVEATKFTEVGYVGKDVESIIRDLVDSAVKMTRGQAMARVRSRAEDAAYVCQQFGVDPERPLMLQVSRFDPWKDPVGVIDAYRAVTDEIPEVQLALVGSMATDDPEVAANSAQQPMLVWRSPPGNRASQADSAMYMRSAMPERSSSSPSSTNRGIEVRRFSLPTPQMTVAIEFRKGMP